MLHVRLAPAHMCNNYWSLLAAICQQLLASQACSTLRCSAQVPPLCSSRRVHECHKLQNVGTKYYLAHSGPAGMPGMKAMEPVFTLVPTFHVWRSCCYSEGVPRWARGAAIRPVFACLVDLLVPSMSCLSCDARIKQHVSSALC